jgi:hypothetical protein
MLNRPGWARLGSAAEFAGGMPGGTVRHGSDIQPLGLVPHCNAARRF